jgi:hypothetical protein
MVMVEEAAAVQALLVIGDYLQVALAAGVEKVLQA